MLHRYFSLVAYHVPVRNTDTIRLGYARIRVSDKRKLGTAEIRRNPHWIRLWVINLDTWGSLDIFDSELG